MKYAILISLVSLSAQAFFVESRTPDGMPVRLGDGDEASPGIDVTYRINGTDAPGGETTLAAIRTAFDTWSSTECTSIVFREGEPSTENRLSHWMYDDGAVYALVFFSNSNEEWTSIPSAGHFYFAHDGTGRIVGITIVLNSRDHQWATDGNAQALDVQGTVTALIGRALGITSGTTGNATFPSYAPGDISKRTLGADDIAAVQWLYHDASCADPTMGPEDVCTGASGCPPIPTTTADGGGVIPPNRDAGSVTSRDAGVDAGTGARSGGGCSIAHQNGGSMPYSAIAIFIVGLAWQRHNRGQRARR